MRTKRKVVTAQTIRDKGTDRALVIGAASLVVAVLVVVRIQPAVPGMTETVGYTTAAVALGIAALAVALVLWRRPAALVPAIKRRGLGRAERKFARRLRKSWVNACRDAGLAREEPQSESLIVWPPRVVTVKPVPLGMQLDVEAVRGRPAREIADKAENLASALGVWLRAEVTGPKSVCLTAELRNPLDGIRTAGTATTSKIVVGRCDDGADAAIDLADAAHIAIQGMTRSGKSALCYTVIGQVASVPNVRLSGIDPNQVLLDPVARASDPSRFVLGSDAEGALALLDDMTELMNERLAMLPRLGIEAINQFSVDMPVDVLVLEEYASLIRNAAAHDEGLKPAERVEAKIKQRVGRLVSEGAKAGIRVILITQRMDASIVDGATRAQLGTRITMGVDNGDAVRMLHPEASP